MRKFAQSAGDHFGFKHRLWVFSGRRGVHCWVADKIARSLTNAGRSAVAEYLSLVVGETKTVHVEGKKGFVHPMISDAYKIIMESGEIDKMVIEQGWMQDNAISRLVSTCSNPDVKVELSGIIAEVLKEPSFEKRWAELRKKLDPIKLREIDGQQSQEVSREAIFHFQGFVLYSSYPRLDVNVSTNTNHLLKSPFCIHPKTGCVAVPLTPGQVTHMNLSSLPRIDQLLTELANVKKTEAQEDRKILEYRHTSLAPYIETFEAFVDGVIKETREAFKRQPDGL